MREHDKKHGHGESAGGAAGGDETKEKRIRVAMAKRKAKRAEARATGKDEKHGGKKDGVKADAGALATPDVAFSTAEAEEDAKGAGNIFAEDETGEPAPGEEEARVKNPNQDGGLFDGHHQGMEHVKDEGDEAVKEDAEMVGQGGKLSGMTGGASMPEGLQLAAEAPDIVLALRKGEFLDAFRKLAWASKEQIGEALAVVGEKYGIPGVAKSVETIAAHGLELNVLLGLIDWTKKGFEEIHRAHELGNQETRIDLYADAYAHAFLAGGGGQSQLRAVTPEEIEAVRLGKEDGLEAFRSTGDVSSLVGKDLLKTYGSEEAAAKHIKTYLFEQAGLGHQAMARSGP